MELSDLYKLAFSHIIFIFYIPYKTEKLHYVYYVKRNWVTPLFLYLKWRIQ